MDTEDEQIRLINLSMGQSQIISKQKLTITRVREYIYNRGGFPIGAFPLLTQQFAAFLRDEKCIKKAKHNRFKRKRERKLTPHSTKPWTPLRPKTWFGPWAGKEFIIKEVVNVIRFMWCFSFIEGIWQVSDNLWSSGPVTVTRGGQSQQLTSQQTHTRIWPVNAAWTRRLLQPNEAEFFICATGSQMCPGRARVLL